MARPIRFANMRDTIQKNTTQKSGETVEVTLPILPQLQATLAAGPIGEATYIAGARGKPSPRRVSAPPSPRPASSPFSAAREAPSLRSPCARPGTPAFSIDFRDSHAVTPLHWRDC